MLVGMSTPSKPEYFVVRKNFPVGFDSVHRSTCRASGFWRVDAPSRIQGSWQGASTIAVRDTNPLDVRCKGPAKSCFLARPFTARLRSGPPRGRTAWTASRPFIRSLLLDRPSCTPLVLSLSPLQLRTLHLASLDSACDFLYLSLRQLLVLSSVSSQLQVDSIKHLLLVHYLPARITLSHVHQTVLTLQCSPTRPSCGYRCTHRVPSLATAPHSWKLATHSLSTTSARHGAPRTQFVWLSAMLSVGACSSYVRCTCVLALMHRARVTCSIS
jgi:hypothetical protein